MVAVISFESCEREYKINSSIVETLNHLLEKEIGRNYVCNLFNPGETATQVNHPYFIGRKGLFHAFTFTQDIIGRFDPLPEYKNKKLSLLLYKNKYLPAIKRVIDQFNKSKTMGLEIRLRE